MSELDAGVTLTPEENAFFESGGQTPPEKPATEQQQTQTEPTEGKDKVSGKDGEQEKAEKVVPLGALHEERGKRKALEQRLRDIEIQNARYAERFKVIEEVGSKKEPAEPPDIATDPLGHLQHISAELGQTKQKLSTIEQQEQARDLQTRVVGAYAQDAARFKAETPDFSDAYGYLVDSRVKEYQLIGHQDPVSAAQADEFQIVQMALQQGKSPAEIIYGLAKTRGFQGKAPEKAQEKPAAEKLAQIDKGQQANKSLASAGGSAGADEMTAQQLLEMPMDEFEAWVGKNPAKAKRLMGG
jgi:hypothetical protein